MLLFETEYIPTYNRFLYRLRLIWTQRGDSGDQHSNLGS
jgi:hypothetical protein